MTWDTFERLFKENYFNIDHRQAIAKEYKTLHQGSMTITEYYNRFIELAQYARAGTRDTPTLIAKFRKRLRDPPSRNSSVTIFLVWWITMQQHSRLRIVFRRLTLSVPEHATPSGSGSRKITYRGRE